MLLNHLSLPVKDITPAANFFIEFFDFELTDKKGEFVAILKGENNFTLVLTQYKQDAEPAYPADFHFGFLQNSEEQVYAIYERLVAGGLDIAPPKSIRGNLGFYFNGPDGVLMEVSCA